MKIDRLTIQGFRGIGNPLELHLNSGLTILYAPNGTGKTSVCDAIEWLLTGKIHRFESTATGLKEIIANKNAPEPPTKVSADITVGGEQRSIERTLDRLRWSQGGALRIVQQNILSQWMSGSSGSSNPSLVQSRARLAWLVGTRFLTGNLLGLLVDEGDSENGHRKEVFSELLGISELERIEKSIASSRERFPSRRKREGLVADEMSKLQTLQRSLRPILDNRQTQRQEIDSQIVSILHQCASLLKFPLPDNVIESAPVASSAMLARARVGLSDARRKVEVLERIKNGLPEFFIAENRFGLMEIEKASKLNEAATLNREYSVVSEELDRNSRDYQRLSQRFELTKNSMSQISEISDRISNLVIRLMELNGLAARRPLSVTKRTSEIERITQRVARVREAKLNLEIGLAQKTQLVDSIKEMAELEAFHRFKELELLKYPQASECQLRLSSINARLEPLEAKMALLSNSFEELRLGGINFVNSNQDISDCVLCGHQYETPERLNLAISQAMSLVPESISSLNDEIGSLREQRYGSQMESRRREAIESELRAISQKLSDLNLRWESVAAEAQINLFEQLIRDEIKARPQLEVMALPPCPPVKTNAWINWIEEANSLAPRVLYVMENDLKSESEARDVVAELVQNVDRIVSLYQEVLPGNLIEFSTAELPPIQFGQVIASLHERLRETLLELETASTLKQSELRIIAGRADERKMQLEHATAAVNFISQDIEMLMASRAKVMAQWIELAPGRVLSEREVENLASEIKSQLEEFAQAEELSLIGASLVSQRGQIDELGELANEVERQEKEVLRAQEWYSYWDNVDNQLDLAGQEILRAKTAYVQGQLQPLHDVISSIYRRAQVNAVFDDIAPTIDEEGSLHWNAYIGEMPFTPQVYMSQGQRQDLALAVFFARARTLGGSFFLDEPLVHLDDLNRVAIMDLLRVLTIENLGRMNLVMTTSSKRLLSHFREKFSLVEYGQGNAPLRVYEIQGNSKTGQMSYVVEDVGLRVG